MKKIIRSALLVTAAALTLAGGCSNTTPGTVTNRTYWRVYVKTDAGPTKSFHLAKWYRWSGCKKDARWPECKG
jgi:hypothetical protein